MVLLSAFIATSVNWICELGPLPLWAVMIDGGIWVLGQLMNCLDDLKLAWNKSICVAMNR